MGTQEPLIIHYTNPGTWLPEVTASLKATVNKNSLSFDNEIGKGTIYKVDIDWGLGVRKMKAFFHQPVIFERDPVPDFDKGHYILLSNLGEQSIETTTTDQQFELGYTSEEGIYFSSPLLSSSFFIEPGKNYHIIYIIISHDRVKDFIARQPERQHDLLQSIIDKDKPIYHVEYLDASLLQMLKDIDEEMNDDRLNNLLIHSRTLEFCYQILSRIEQRNASDVVKIHPDDVVKLKEVRKQLSEGYKLGCPPIEEMAKRTGMSPTKFKKLFRQMFGQSYYQYYKNVRMYKAKELLEKRKMNVSEVGYLLGYNNLSKFSRAFKSKFKTTPGKINSN